MSARQITVTIDRIVSDDPSLDRAALMRALRAEIQARLQAGGTLGAAGARESESVQAVRSARSVPEQIAQATLRGLRR